MKTINGRRMVLVTLAKDEPTRTWIDQLVRWAESLANAHVDMLAVMGDYPGWRIANVRYLTLREEAAVTGEKWGEA